MRAPRRVAFANVFAASAASPAPIRPVHVGGVALGELRSRLVDTREISLAGRNEHHGRSPRMTGVTLRAQHVQLGDLFAALPGLKTHGADHAAEAIQHGAVAVLTDIDGVARMRAANVSVGSVLIHEHPREVLGPVAAQIYGDPSTGTAVLGVTGTSGKTTTCYFVEAALTGAGIRTGLIGTVESRIAGEVVPSGLTTPEAPDLQALFAVMVERDIAAVAMEVSSHALALGRVSGTRFAVGAFLNLTRDHLDFHPDMEAYFRAKCLLFDGRAGCEVIDVDDEYGRRLAKMRPGALTVSASGHPADVVVREIRPVSGGRQQLVIGLPSGEVSGVLGVPGAFNAANAAMALALIERAGLGVDPAAAMRGLAEVVVPGRMQRVEAGQDFLAVVDYAHKPAALDAVLSAIGRELPGRLIAIVGAGGDRDRGKRPRMGEIAAAWADVVIVTDDNPRSESPADIRAAILSGALSAPDRHRPGRAVVQEIGDRRAAIRAAVALAGSGDAVVLAGKGHEQGQDAGAVVYPFSDRDELAAALAEVDR